MRFNINDYVKIISGFRTGQKGRIIDMSPQTYVVKMETTGLELGYIEMQLELDEEKKIKVYGTAFGKIAGLKHTN